MHALSLAGSQPHRFRCLLKLMCGLFFRAQKEREQKHTERGEVDERERGMQRVGKQLQSLMGREVGRRVGRYVDRQVGR